MPKQKRFKWKLEVELDIAECWVADGFDPGNGEWSIADVIQEAILQYAHDDEKVVKATIKKAPPVAAIRKAQGYKS